MDWSGYAFDVQHALVGDTPPVFFAEVVGRTVLLLLFALFLVRMLGKRGLGQVSPYEFVVLISMGSALGDPMFYPDVPLLPPMIVLATIVAMQKLISWLTEKSHRFEAFVEGRCRVCVQDGRVIRKALHQEQVPFDELTMMLRAKGIENLASVRLAILETSGCLSVFPFDDSRASDRVGLPLEALAEPDSFPRQRVGDSVGEATTLACVACGHCRSVARGQRIQPCCECAGEEFVTAAGTQADQSARA